MKELYLRRSVRAFSEKPVSDESIQRLLKAAMTAPSATNQQPWHFIVIKDAEKIQALSHTSRGAGVLKTAKVCIVMVMPEETALPKGDMAPQDMSAATQNLLIQAVAENLGACWIGVYPLNDRIETVKGLCRIPKTFVPFAMIALGHPEHPNANHEVDRFQADRINYEEWQD